jgi:hypothetical protein
MTLRFDEGEVALRVMNDGQFQALAIFDAHEGRQPSSGPPAHPKG